MFSDQSITQAITQAVTQAAKAAKMVVREAEGPTKIRKQCKQWVLRGGGPTPR